MTSEVRDLTARTAIFDWKAGGGMAQETRVRTEAGVEVKLPKLPVGIFQGDTLLRTIELDDPRELLLDTFNRENRELGLTAKLP
jgi:hypothetical protein